MIKKKKEINVCVACRRGANRTTLYEISEGKYLCTGHYFFWFSMRAARNDPNLIFVS